MGDFFELTPKTKGLDTSGHLTPMVDRASGDIKVVRVEVLDGGSFTLSLIDSNGYEPEKTIREIKWPDSSGHLIEINERVDHDLGYRLKCNDDKSFHVNIAYERVPPRKIIPSISPLGLLD